MRVFPYKGCVQIRCVGSPEVSHSFMTSCLARKTQLTNFFLYIIVYLTWSTLRLWLLSKFNLNVLNILNFVNSGPDLLDFETNLTWVHHRERRKERKKERKKGRKEWRKAKRRWRKEKRRTKTCVSIFQKDGKKKFSIVERKYHPNGFFFPPDILALFISRYLLLLSRFRKEIPLFKLEASKVLLMVPHWLVVKYKFVLKTSYEIGKHRVRNVAGGDCHLLYIHSVYSQHNTCWAKKFLHHRGGCIVGGGSSPEATRVKDLGLSPSPNPGSEPVLQPNNTPDGVRSLTLGLKDLRLLKSQILCLKHNPYCPRFLPQRESERERERERERRVRER